MNDEVTAFLLADEGGYSEEHYYQEARCLLSDRQTETKRRGKHYDSIMAIRGVGDLRISSLTACQLKSSTVDVGSLPGHMVDTASSSISKHVTYKHVTSEHVTSKHVTSEHVTSEHVASEHVTSEHVIDQQGGKGHTYLRYSYNGDTNVPVTDSTLFEDGDLFFFFQEESGLQIYLHPLNVRCLKHEYGGVSRSPSTITAPILDIQRFTMSHDFRKRNKFLSHVPLGCEVLIAEVDLSHVLGKETTLFFRSLIQQRKSDRKKKFHQELRSDKITHARNSASEATALKIAMAYPTGSGKSSTAHLESDLGGLLSSPPLTGSTSSIGFIAPVVCDTPLTSLTPHADFSFSRALRGVMSDPRANPPLGTTTNTTCSTATCSTATWAWSRVPAPPSLSMTSPVTGSSGNVDEEDMYRAPLYQVGG